MSRKVLLIGGGGHCKDVIWLLRESIKPEFLGIIDGRLPVGATVCGVPVLGDDLGLERFSQVEVIIAIGSSRRRFEVWKAICHKFPHFRFPSVIHPSVKLAPGVRVGEGTLITAGSTIANDVIIGNQVVVNLQSIIGHDSTIGDSATLAPGTVIAGGVTVGEGFEFGPNSTVGSGLQLGAWGACGPGAGIMANSPERTLMLGNPARPIRTLDLPTV
ncbi:MAG: NeuD/PglB/VioB family sugar acetyltransferase [Planctomycetota bacterium]